MQESTPLEIARSSRACPTDEQLAAYIDGTLGKAESERITAHLASCRDCYDLYMETAHFLVNSSAATPEDAKHEWAEAASRQVARFPVPIERARPLAQWLSIAALLLVGAGGGTYFQFLQAPPALM